MFWSLQFMDRYFSDCFRINELVKFMYWISLCWRHQKLSLELIDSISILVLHSPQIQLVIGYFSIYFWWLPNKIDIIYIIIESLSNSNNLCKKLRSSIFKNQSNVSWFFSYKIFNQYMYQKSWKVQQCHSSILWIENIKRTMKRK